MVLHPIKTYITQARQQGMNNEAIIQALTSAGWRVHDIVDIVAEPDQKESQERSISVRNVSKHYGKVIALDNVSLEVNKGTVTALLGPNGAGKTTLVRILTTLLKPTYGSATVAGFDVQRDGQQLRAAIGLAGQNAAVDEILTGRENLEMVGRLYHFDKRTSTARAAELLKQFDLEEAADRTLRTYSGGMRRRLDLASSIVAKPQVLFLDEPTTGLDPQSRFSMWNVIRDLVADGTTVLLTTQYMEEADQLAKHIFVVDHGHIIAEGSPDQLKRQIGGDVLELHLATHSDVSRAVEVIRRFGSDQPHPDSTTGIVTMATSRGATILVEAVRQLDAAGLKLSDVILRRPSLDDVFLKLTGHTT